MTGSGSAGLVGGWSRSLTRSARRGTVFAVLCCVLLAAPGTRATTSTPSPRNTLLTARSNLVALGHSTSTPAARALLRAAAASLTSATAPSLWIDSSDVVAPPYGTRVFVDARAAVGDLQRVTRTSASTSADQLIVGAEGALARQVLVQAAPGNKSLRGIAEHDLATGNHAVARRQFTQASTAYTAAWEVGFTALTDFVTAAVTHVPSDAFAAGAQNALNNPDLELFTPRRVDSKSPLTSDGKPEVLFVGSEACAACAAQSWALVTALSQFGTFSNLKLTESAATAGTPVAGLTFLGATYQSPFISFQAIELSSNVPLGRGFAPLQHLTPVQARLMKALDPGGVMPFIDVANQSRTIGASSTSQPTQPWAQTAASLSAPQSISAEAILGSAAVDTAVLCAVTGGSPTSVCNSGTVQQFGNVCRPTLPPLFNSVAVRSRRTKPPVASAAHCGGGSEDDR
jgi:Domain of unknown function (DUF929)